MSYTFDLQWVNGKNNVIADALSRAPICSPTQEDHCCCKAISPTTITAELKPFLDSAQLDNDYQSIVNALLTDANPKQLSFLSSSLIICQCLESFVYSF